MNKLKTSPKFLKIIKNDLAAFLATTFMVIMWAIVIVLFVWGDKSLVLSGREVNIEDIPIFSYMALAATLIFVVVLIARWRHFSNLFVNGVELKGTITDISFFKDRGKIAFKFLLEGREYNCVNHVHKSGDTKKLPKGSEVLLLVDKNNREKACVRGFFE